MVGFWQRGLLPRNPLIGVPVLFIEMLILIVPSAALPDLLLSMFAQSYPLSALATGLADTAGGVLAFMLAPTVGAWSDTHGRKAMLLLLSLVSFVPIFCLTLYPSLNLWAYLATRGLGKISAFGVLFSCIADLAAVSHRSPMYSRLSGFGTIAMVAGPFISMKTSTVWSFRACGIMAAATLLYITLLPETLQAKTSDSATRSDRDAQQVQAPVLASWSETLTSPLLASSPSDTEVSTPPLLPLESNSAGSPPPANTIRPLALIRLAFRLPAYRRISFILFFSQLSQNGIHSCAMLFLKQRLHFTKNDNNWLLLVMGCWAVLLMVFVVPFALAHQWRLRTVIFVGLAADMCHQTMYIVLPSYEYFYLIAFFQGLSFISYPAAVGALSRCGGEFDQGFVLAMSGGLRSLTQAIAPLVFNGLMSYFGWDRAFVHFPEAPFVLAMACILVAAGFTMRMQEEEVHVPQKQQEPDVDPPTVADTVTMPVADTVSIDSIKCNATKTTVAAGGDTLHHLESRTHGDQAPERRRRVVIFHGNVNTGKTWRAAQWVKEQRHLGVLVGGLLAEKTADGRVFVDLQSGEQCRMEHPDGVEAIVSIGRFQFRLEAFHFATRCIESALTLGAVSILIDEFGPLEVRGEGFAHVLQRILLQHPQAQAVILVRSSLVDHLVETIHAAGVRDIAFEPPLSDARADLRLTEQSPINEIS